MMARYTVVKIQLDDPRDFVIVPPNTAFESFLVLSMTPGTTPHIRLGESGAGIPVFPGFAWEKGHCEPAEVGGLFFDDRYEPRQSGELVVYVSFTSATARTA